MDKNTVLFRIYKEENDSEWKEYIFNINEKIIDIKKRILRESFNNEYNQLEMVNITDRVYKDYGKLFFDIGLLPSSIHNYKLAEFTNEGRVFSFLTKGVNEVIKKEDIKKEVKLVKKDNNKKLFDDQFPPLPSKKK
jgi:hypothetical protein